MALARIPQKRARRKGCDGSWIMGWQRFWRSRVADTAARLGVETKNIQRRYAEALSGLVQPGARWLDIGCGRQIVPDWAMPAKNIDELAARPSLLMGIDFDSAIFEHPHLHFRAIASGYQLPFRENSFDLISANMVVEHLDQPLTLLREVHRALSPGGRFVFITPNARYYLIGIARHVPDKLKKQIVWILEKRKESDVFPTHYRCNTDAEVSGLARQAGFQIERLELVDSSPQFHAFGPVGVAEIVSMKYRRPENRSNLISVLRKSG